MSVESHDPVFYPESGPPPTMSPPPEGESDRHRDEASSCAEILRWHFRDDPLAYVASNNFLYYEEGNPKAVVSPDVYVVRGVAKGPRRIYQLWKEGGHAPCFVMELSSRSTWLEDNGNKKAIYAMLGVREYVMFDPEADCLDPPLQAFRLGDDGDFHRVALGETSAFSSETLGLTLWLDEDRKLQARDTATGDAIPRPQDAYLRIAEQQARMAEQEARIAQLEAELAKRNRD
jgi:Uma2 family endonuclease